MSVKIDRRQFLQTGAATLAVSTAPLGGQTVEAARKPFNVLYVIVFSGQQRLFWVMWGIRR